ncbi:MAG: hypothetical protein PWQ72_2090 [Pseudothermotoga sp.]|nr:hypothetical protein [Pseudothermotoga sp.]MDK2954482.1 hypothetical protein [Kosmotoga sp.]
MEKVFQEAIGSFESGKFNTALRKFKEVLKHDPYNRDAHYYMCMIYHRLKKWSNCKNCAQSFVKRFGRDSDILEMLGDVYFFEGDYRRAIKIYKVALSSSNFEIRKRLNEKIQKTSEIKDEKKSQPKLAVVISEGGDNFTDDLIENLSKQFWVRKFIVPSTTRGLLHIIVTAKRKKALNEKLYKLALKSVGHRIRKVISWADATWCEWADPISVVASHIKPKDKKLFIRLHRYEAFTDMPFMINWSNVDGLIFVSGFMKNILEKRGLDMNKVNWEVVYNGVDPERFTFKKRTKGYNIAWVAYIIPRKNLYMALEIMKKLVTIDPSYKLHVAGDFKDPEYETFIKHAVQIMDLDQNVVFHGWIDDVNQFLEDKNYLLSTSSHESFGYNIAEAMTRGIKPIIYNFYDASELFPKELLFNNIEEAVEKFLSDDYDSERYRKHIYQKGWTVENQAKAFEKLVLSLLNKT